MEIEIKVRPFPAVRSNRNTWSPSVKKYHSLMNDLRLAMGNGINLVRNLLNSGECEIIFVFAIPKSYSQKKAQETQNKPFLQKPDLDNLFKALADTVFYKSDDSGIYSVKMSKVWASIGEESKIILKN